MLLPLNLPPGLYRQGTDMQSAGRWRDANLVRWREGAFGPVGGWSTRVAVTDQPIRGALAWRDNGGDRRVACGTFEGLFVFGETGTVTDITPTTFTTGLEDASYNLGYGGGLYGLGTYGTPRAESGTITEATVWSLDTWGQNLVGCSSADGQIVEWDLNVANPAAAISGAPTGALSIIVTDERFLFALGAGNRRRVTWSDREDNTTWTPAATNEAGDYDLQTAGTLQQGLRVRGQTLLLTDLDAHAATYVGPPFVYGFERVGTSCGAISRQAGCVAEGIAYWMGRDGFYRYAGGVVEPIKCDVADYVFQRMSVAQRSKVAAVVNASNDEIWWFYPGGVENDSYVAFNFREGHWTTGALGRTCGFDAGIFAFPMWFCSGGNAYDHETGNSYDGAEVFAESGPISLGNGDKVMAVVGMLPDEITQGDTTATFKTRFYPNATEREYGPYTMAAPTSVRFTGRQIRLRVTGDALTRWRVGVPRLDVRERGTR